MKLPRFRFTIRRMMVAVAIVALVCLMVAMKQRRDKYLAKAASFASAANLYVEYKQTSLELAALTRKSAQIHRKLAAEIQENRLTAMLFSPPGSFRTPEHHLAEAEKLEARATGYDRSVEARAGKFEWNSRLKAKYERAATRPWIPMAPDLPQPD